MASKFENQVTSPLHIENSVNCFAKEELKLPQAFKTYRAMLLDEQISGGFSLIQNLINKVDYCVVAPEDASEAVKRHVAKLNKSLNNLEGMNKVDFMNYVLSMLQYGHSIFEPVYTRDGSNFVLKAMSPIHPIDVKKYVYKRNSLVRLELNTADNDGLIEQEMQTQLQLDGEKVLMFKLNADLDHPLGRSMLDRCYTAWRQKGIASEYELIGIAKDLSGVVKISAPAEYIQDWYSSPASDNAKYMDELLTQAELLHAGKTSNVMVASDTNQNGVALFDISTIGGGGGSFEINTTIERLNSAILTSLYTDILSLGQTKGGSLSLGDNKTNILTLFIDSLLTLISRSFEQVIKQSLDLSGISYDTTPKLVFAEVEKLDVETFTRGWQRLAQGGLVQPDEELENYLRKEMKGPKADKKSVLQTESSADPVERTDDAKSK